jgi:hypothetical protein
VTPLRLAIDLSGGMIRVLEGNPGGPMRSGEAAAPPGSITGGSVTDSGAVAKALRQLLARTEITETRALIAASDSLASFRVLSFADDAGQQEIETTVQRLLPTDSGRMAVHRHQLGRNGGSTTIYAVAFDRAAIQALAATARLAGVEPAAVELKSISVARLAPMPSCVVLDLAVEPAEVFLIDASLPRLWHSFKAKLENGDEDVGKIAAGLRTVLNFYKRPPSGATFGPEVPVLISGDHSLTAQAAVALEDLIGHRVGVLQAMARVPGGIRYGTYLACLGLIMRRQ